VRGRGWTLLSAILAVAGLALVGFETARSLQNKALGTTGAVLIYVGLGLFVVAAILVVVSLVVDAEASPVETATSPPQDEPHETLDRLNS
jgi:uncharacterized membrane protein YhiD involved in acid resistance